MSGREIHGLPMAEYLALPAFSASLASVLLDECPRSAWHASWLNPVKPPPDDTDGSDLGTVAHAVLLEGSMACVRGIDPREHPNMKGEGIPRGWTNKSIKAARDEARAEGLIPMLLADVEAVKDMRGAAIEYIESLKETEPAVWAMFQPDGGDSELTMTWDADGVLCKMRPDRISKDRRILVNYKSTKTSVEPDRWGRGPLLDYYVGGAFYARGVHEMHGTLPAHLYLVQSVTAPYLCSLIGMSPGFMDLGLSKVDWALASWKRCLAEGRWPGYANRASYPEMPAWLDAQWLEREIENSAVQ